jgi:hypothetical protein
VLIRLGLGVQRSDLPGVVASNSIIDAAVWECRAEHGWLSGYRRWIAALGAALGTVEEAGDGCSVSGQSKISLDFLGIGATGRNSHPGRVDRRPFQRP